jgi:prolyl 4-hydroxylase
MCSDDYTDLAYAEPMIIYRYTQGQQYKWHYDFITPSNENAKKELNFFGQRKRTRIINLNDRFEGGETTFKDWDISIKAKQGQVIKFNNMIGNRVDKNSVHSGKPILLGEKWICTLWMREKPFWLRESIWCEN